jgi:signal peptide peptidase SppA
MKYNRIIAEFYGKVWAIREETLLAMQYLLAQHASGVKWTAEEIRARIAAANEASGYKGHESMEARFLAFDDEPMPMQSKAGQRNAAKGGSVAVIPMTGIISHRMSMMSEISGGGGGSTQALTAQFRQALEDGNCKAIVFDVDSPGGSIEGVTELASEIYNARKQKPITAVCNAMAASAAYWLASAAGELVCTPSGQAGSIGCFMIMQEYSQALESEGVKVNIIKAGKYKAEGNPYEPLSADTRAFLQSQCDSFYSMFVKAVAQHRGVAQAAVRDGYGQGRCLLAADALKAGLVDRLATLDDVLAKYGVKNGGSAHGAARAEVAALDFSAKTPADDPDNDEDDNYCACNCAACEGCTGMGANARADQGTACECECNACEACANKSGAAAVIPPLTASALTAEEEAAKAAAAGEYLTAIARRRRQMHLL